MKQSTAVQKAGPAPHLRLVPADQMLDHMKETFDAIARRAFEIFDGSGRRLGRDLEDWFQAEAELLHPVHLEISDTDDAITVRAEVPGFSEKDLEVSVEPRRLTISGKRESTREGKEGKTVYSERCSDQIFRAVDLPAVIDPAAATKATYDQGVLTINLPKTKEPQGRRVKVEPKPPA
ncbi:MAG TPA: Hsp20/alpha crystallin family protein [Gemmatimonadales bacterium]|nr:Hsp20/alpha crystallin family protein [Gemmatimonadales bacterium]